jgi:uncharacterized YigZ family protein
MDIPVNDTFLTFSRPSEGVYKEKGSRFMAYAWPVSSEDEAKRHIKELKKVYHDARHHVYAFRLGVEGNVYRCSDDGEPSNSSGPPVLGQLLSNNLTNALIVVVRYFGGTKLGVPGLINAYRMAAADAIANNQVVEKFDQDVFTIRFEYLAMNEVMRIMKEENPEQANQQFDNECSIQLLVRKQNGARLRAKLLKVEGLIID